MLLCGCNPKHKKNWMRCDTFPQVGEGELRVWMKRERINPTIANWMFELARGRHFTVCCAHLQLRASAGVQGARIESSATTNGGASRVGKLSNTIGIVLQNNQRGCSQIFIYPGYARVE